MFTSLCVKATNLKTNLRNPKIFQLIHSNKNNNKLYFTLPAGLSFDKTGVKLCFNA